MTRVKFYFAVLLALMWSCSDMDYDVSKGVDSEVTLFSDQVSLPVGDIGPITYGSFLEGSDLSDAIMLVAKEDAEGYLTVEEDQSFYSNVPLFLSIIFPDIATMPIDIPVDDVNWEPGDGAAAMEVFGFDMNPQTLSILVSNPLTEDIELSRKVTLKGVDDKGDPTVTLYTQEFSNVKAAPGSDKAEVFSVKLLSGKAAYACQLENLSLHLPESIMEKDPSGGMGVIELSSHYKSYMSLAEDVPDVLPVMLDDVDIPLSQFRVKEARIRADVSSEIPVTLLISDVEAMVEQAGEDGGTTLVPAGNLEVSAGVTIASGQYGAPVETPLEFTIKAKEGVIPDIAGLRLNIHVNAPTGSGDNRMNMKEEISFNNIRATVFGGITFQGK